MGLVHICSLLTSELGESGCGHRTCGPGNRTPDPGYLFPMVQATLVLAPEALAPAKARELLAGVLGDQVGCEWLARAQLAVSEVVTNAVRHGGTGEPRPLTLVIERTDGLVNVSVTQPGRCPRGHPSSTCPIPGRQAATAYASSTLSLTDGGFVSILPRCGSSSGCEGPDRASADPRAPNIRVTVDRRTPFPLPRRRRR